MDLPRYRHQTPADLMHVILDPLMRDRVAIAYAQSKDALVGSEASSASRGHPIGCPRFTGSRDAKLTEQNYGITVTLYLTPKLAQKLSCVSADTNGDTQ